MGKLLKKPKFLILLLTAVILLTMVFYCLPNQKSIALVQAQGINGVLRVSPDNPRYFTDDNGKAIYLTGSHTWANLVDMEQNDPPSPFNFDQYLDFMESRNHNFIRLWSWELFTYENRRGRYYSAPKPWPRTGSGTALDGKPKFDLSEYDSSYFGRLRYRVKAARDRGIYVAVMLFEGYGVNKTYTPWAWNGHPFNINNNVNGIDGNPNGDDRGTEIHTLEVPAVTQIQKEYIRKVIDTVHDLDNVLYEIGNEIFPGSTEFQYEMINFIKDYEASRGYKKHLVGMTFQFSGGNNADLFASPADWISPYVEINQDYKLNPPAADGRKIIIFDTDHLCGICGKQTADWHLAWPWMSFTRGINPIYMDPYGDYYARSDDPGDESIRDNMGYTLTYANKMDLINMTPSNSSSDCSTTYCLRNPGQEYLIFQPDTGSFTVNLEVGEYDIEWFNPSTGSIVETDTITAGNGNRSFSSPFSGDAVLYLKVKNCLLPDLICNQTIDLTDLNSLKSLWGTNQADFNNDSKTNTQDFAIIMSVWGTY